MCWHIFKVVIMEKSTSQYLYVVSRMSKQDYQTMFYFILLYSILCFIFIYFSSLVCHRTLDLDSSTSPYL